MALLLLGPLELLHNGHEIELGGTRQRAVLAMLALNANRVTPIDLLIDAVWDTSPPATARAQVQICISGLRRVFTDASVTTHIKTRTPGYQLDISPTDLDSEQFRKLVNSARMHVNAGRNSEAVATLRSALGLWRGPALADMHSELVHRGAAQLDDARLSAVTERIRIDLALGRHEEVVGELTALIGEHPLRERLYEHLMVALYRSGRQAEALDVCRKARTTLIEELGIEPGPNLQRLELSILNRDPNLDLQSTCVGSPDASYVPAGTAEHQVVPRRLPACVADFTGRQEQLTAIKRVLAEEVGPRRYGTRIVAISGKGGVGKSTLAVRAAHELSDVYPDGHLYAALESSNEGDQVSSVLDRFLRALGVAGTAIPEDVEEKADMYRSWLAGKRMLLVLDGAASEDRVLPLLPAGPGCAVIVTSQMPLSTLPGAFLLDIDVFDIDMSLEMLGKIVGPERIAAQRPAAVELVNFCGRLPLALRIAGARLASRPHWQLDVLVARLRNTAHRLDELTYRGLELRSSIGLSYWALGDRAKTLFRLFALINAPDFPGWTAAALLDIDSFDAAEVLESLIESQLLDTVVYPGEHLRYRFHDLLRVYAEEQLRENETDADRNAAVTRLLGAWLARAEQAHRSEYGGDFTILHGAGPRWRPEEGAVEIDDPIKWLESERRSLVAAVQLAAATEQHELCWDLALTAVTLFEVKGHFDDWRETAEVALAATRRAGNRRGEATMLYSLGALSLLQKRLAKAEGYFDSALEMFRADDEALGRALVLRSAAAVDRMRGRSAAMLAKYDESLKLMRVVGDPVGEAHILRSIAKLRIDDGDMEQARELLETALARCQRVRYLRGEAQVAHRFAELYLGTNQIEQAHQTLNRVLLIVRDIGDRIGESHALYGLGIVRQRTGRLDNAETTLQHALSLARGVGERLVEGQALYALGEIALARGNNLFGEGYLADASQLFEELDSTVWHAKALIQLSDVHQGRGDMVQASREVAGALALLKTADSREAVRLREEFGASHAALTATDRRN